MTDFSAKVFGASPEQLARLVAAKEPRHEWWEPTELGAIWEHQLAAPLQADLPGAELTGNLVSFADLLQAEAPPLSLLEQAAAFATEQSSNSATAVLPPDIARLLYYACLAAAHAHAHRPIDPHDREACLQGWSWARGLSWLDEPTRQLFDAALTRAKAP